MARSLFDIGNDFIALEQLLDETDGEAISPEADAAFQEFFKGLEKDQGIKLDCYIAVMAKWKSEEVAATAEAEQWSRKAQVRANRQDRLKKSMKEYMEMTKQTELVTDKGSTIKLQNNGGLKPLKIDEKATVDTVPPSFVKVIKQLDNEKIRETLEGGEKLPFAELLPRGQHVRIRK